MRFKSSILLKILVPFSLLIIFSGVAIAGLINYRTKQFYSEWVESSDINRARDFKNIFENYYRDTGSWNNLDEIVLLPGPSQRPMPRVNPRVMQRERGHMMAPLDRVVLVSHENRVIFDSHREIKSGEMFPVNFSRGVAVKSKDNMVGYVFVGSMTEPNMPRMGRELLKSVNRSVLTATSVILAVTLAVGIIIVSHLVSPIRGLKNAALKVADGKLETTVDITRNDELGDLGRSFNAMIKSLRRTEEWRKRIVADAAHELRTPITLIQGRLEMMLEGVYPVERDQVKELFEETKHLSSFVNDLQQLSSTESENLVLKKEKIDIRDSISQTVGMFQTSLEEKNIMIRVESGSLPLCISADPGKILQVLSNIFSNAVRHTPGSGIITVSAAAAFTGTAGPSVLVQVHDTGPGVSEDELEKIFERFYRVDTSRSKEDGGRGLGLSIAQGIIRAHDGEIRAENRSAGGLTIEFTLPIVT
jgi:two-component system, OmpR family, sensor histidine kinase BaeS